MKQIGFVISIIVGVIGWIFFSVLWWWAFTNRAATTNEFRGLVIIALFSVAVIVISSLWVRYNVWLYRHHKWTGPRQPLPASYDYSSDKNGLPVVADFNNLDEVRYITIDIKERNGQMVKIYSLGDPSQSAGKAKICGP